MKKFLKKAEGFTLVELIVVIAILGILAGVAVPAYTGYIKKANDAAVVSELSAVLTAGEASCALHNDDLDGITISDAGDITLDPTSADIVADFAVFYGGTTLASDLDGTSYENGVTWDATNGWKPVPASN